MSTKSSNLSRLIGVLVLTLVMLSCSNKLIISEKRFSAPVKKIVFKSALVCTVEKLIDNSVGKWYGGNGKANTSVGEFLINFDFHTTAGQSAFHEAVFYDFISPSPQVICILSQAQSMQ